MTSFVRVSSSNRRGRMVLKLYLLSTCTDHILGIPVRVKARNYDMQCEIERLKKGEESRVHDMQREMDSVKKQLEEARAELKETQAVLGQAFVSGNVGKRNVSLTEADADKKPIPLPVKAVEDIEKTFKQSFPVDRNY
ncbi:hypothetical protein HYPSUDRAFT_537487 [Hypholoma sublateritium FD-334 SS-4]|uniref:Uncharacterized protein n=1 Tax=Hypholoma sublateritium (strain FD-334 SS-4) TaxID=945553 RepID=A0A0D2P6G9_HYPSF|nr:hypothetical protein HYPSUDRAFT_537487 [Hypholoma sublateritium FD-334 SS-4]